MISVGWFCRFQIRLVQTWFRYLKVAIKVNVRASLCAETRTLAGLHAVDSVHEMSDESESTGRPLGANWEQLPWLEMTARFMPTSLSLPAWLDSVADGSIQLPH